MHWLAYASWPIAFAHGIGSSTDLQHGPLLVLAIACAALIAAALAWRVIAVAREVPRARRVSALMGRSLVTGPRGAQQPAASATRPRNPTVVP